MKRLFTFLVCAACLLAGCAGTPAESPSPSLTINGPSPSPDPSPELSPEPSPIVWDKSVFWPEEMIDVPLYGETQPIYSDRQKMLLFGKTEPSVRFTCDFGESQGSIAPYVFWSDDRYHYITGSKYTFYFEDGRKMRGLEALEGGFINGEDLILNDMPWIFVIPLNEW
jgi:hypothetical protein